MFKLLSERPPAPREREGMIKAPFGAWSSEQVCKQRNQRRADQGDAAARDKLLDALTASAGVIVSVTFQQIDSAPNAECSAEGDHKGLENADCGLEKCHE